MLKKKKKHLFIATRQVREEDSRNTISDGLTISQLTRIFTTMILGACKVHSNTPVLLFRENFTGD